MDSRHGFATQISFYKDRPILGCHFDIALMHKSHFLKSRQNATFWAKVGEMGVGKTGVGKRVSLIAGMEYGMKQWNGKWNGW